MKTEVLPDMIINFLFEQVVKSLKNGEAAKVSEIAKYAISQYYLKHGSRNHHFDLFNSFFVDEYVNHESLVEGVVEEKSVERKGLKKVYDYIFSDQLNENFDIEIIKKYHKLLFSETPHPEAAGYYRNAPARIDGAAINLYNWEEIEQALHDANKELKQIIEEANKIFGTYEFEEIFEYINRCIRLNCHLIHIHPFFDGNGRTIRALTNKLFILGGVPPIYVHTAEKKIYNKAMQKAIAENNYEDIYGFYYLKICQSIYELDLNPTDELQRKKDKKLIKRIVENYKCYYQNESFSASDASIYFSSSISRDLDTLDISYQKYSLGDFIDYDEDYEYLLVQGDSKKTQWFLIDLAFSKLVVEKELPFPQNINLEESSFLQRLYSQGYASVNMAQYRVYFDVLKNLRKEKSNRLKKLL